MAVVAVVPEAVSSITRKRIQRRRRIVRVALLRSSWTGEEAYRRALSRADGLLRSQAGRGVLPADLTKGMTACSR
jgi:hypothetical protein